MEPKEGNSSRITFNEIRAKHDMQRIADNVQQYAEALNAKYVLKEEV